MKKLNKKQAKAIAKQELKLRNKLTLKQFKRVKRAFAKLKEKIDLETAILTATAYNEFKTELYVVFRTGIKETVKETAEFLRTVRKVNKELIPVVRNKSLERLSEEITAKKVTNVTEVTKEKINKIITQGQATGKNVKAIAKEVQKSINGMSKHRAMMIARTETAGTSSLTYHTGLVEAGFDKTWWHVGGGKQDRESHLACDGETIKADEIFSCGLKFPHDPDADAGDIINCHCELV